MHSFLSKVFGRKERDTETSPTTLRPGELLDGKFEAISPNVSPSATNFLELESSKTDEENGKEKDKDRDIRFSLFKVKSRPSPPEITYKTPVPLPQLSLNFSATNGESSARTLESFLSVDPDAQILLSDAIIGRRRLNPLEALVLIRACSQAIVAKGLETLGVMHPHWYSASPEVQRRLLSQFIHSMEPKTPLTALSLTPALASSPFESEIESTRSPHDVAAVLRWGLRHIQLEGDSFGTDDGWYKVFLDAEAAAEYPPKAFSEKLAPALPKAHLDLLIATLEIFSSLAAHSEANSTSGSKLSKIFGLWLLTSKRVEDKDDWKSFYARWERMGRILEHLFLSRIRDESTDQRMPIRLLELVRRYPYTHGLSSPSTDVQFLSPPNFTTRHYDALYVRIEVELSSERRRPKLKVHPLNILADAFSTKVEGGEYAELWAKITAASKTGSNPSPLSNIFADETIRFLSIIPDKASDKAQEAKSPVFSLLSPSFARGHSASVGEADRPAPSPSRGYSFSVGEQRRPSHQHTKSATEPPATSAIGSDWVQFSSSGFLDSTPAIAPLVSTLFDTDLEKTTPVATTLSRKSSKRGKAVSRKSVDFASEPAPPLSPPPADPVKKEATAIVRATKLEVIELDEAFIDFWSDSLLDPITATWPTFIICKFKSTLVPHLLYGPIEEGGKQKTLKWLVLEQAFTVRPAPPPSPSAVPLPDSARPVSPALSTSGRNRFSFWSMSRTASSSSQSSQKGKKKERAVNVGEMGELLEEEPAEQIKQDVVQLKAAPSKSKKSKVEKPTEPISQSADTPIAPEVAKAVGTGAAVAGVVVAGAAVAEALAVPVAEAQVLPAETPAPAVEPPAPVPEPPAPVETETPVAEVQAPVAEPPAPIAESQVAADEPSIPEAQEVVVEPLPSAVESQVPIVEAEPAEVATEVQDPPSEEKALIAEVPASEPQVSVVEAPVLVAEAVISAPEVEVPEVKTVPPVVETETQEVSAVAEPESPVAEVEVPVVEAREQIAEEPAHVAEVYAPVAEVEEPVIETPVEKVPAEVTEALEEAIEAETPIVEGPAPIAETPSPAAEVAAPADEVPISTVEETVPVAEVAEEAVEAPAPIAEAPPPVVEVPAPVIEEEMPIVVETSSTSDTEDKAQAAEPLAVDVEEPSNEILVPVAEVQLQEVAHEEPSSFAEVPAPTTEAPAPAAGVQTAEDHPDHPPVLTVQAPAPVEDEAAPVESTVAQEAETSTETPIAKEIEPSIVAEEEPESQVSTLEEAIAEAQAAPIVERAITPQAETPVPEEVSEAPSAEPDSWVTVDAVPAVEEVAKAAEPEDSSADAEPTAVTDPVEETVVLEVVDTTPAPVDELNTDEEEVLDHASSEILEESSFEVIAAEPSVDEERVQPVGVEETAPSTEEVSVPADTPVTAAEETSALEESSPIVLDQAQVKEDVASEAPEPVEPDVVTPDDEEEQESISDIDFAQAAQPNADDVPVMSEVAPVVNADVSEVEPTVLSVQTSDNVVEVVPESSDVHISTEEPPSKSLEEDLPSIALPETIAEDVHEAKIPIEVSSSPEQAAVDTEILPAESIAEEQVVSEEQAEPINVVSSVPVIESIVVPEDSPADALVDIPAVPLVDVDVNPVVPDDPTHVTVPIEDVLAEELPVVQEDSSSLGEHESHLVKDATILSGSTPALHVALSIPEPTLEENNDIPEEHVTEDVAVPTSQISTGDDEADETARELAIVEAATISEPVGDHDISGVVHDFAPDSEEAPEASLAFSVSDEPIVEVPHPDIVDSDGSRDTEASIVEIAEAKVEEVPAAEEPNTENTSASEVTIVEGQSVAEGLADEGPVSTTESAVEEGTSTLGDLTAQDPSIDQDPSPEIIAAIEEPATEVMTDTTVAEVAAEDLASEVLTAAPGPVEPIKNDDSSLEDLTAKESAEAVEVEQIPAEETSLKEPVPVTANELPVEEPVRAAPDEALAEEPLPAAVEEPSVEEPVLAAAEGTLLEEPVPAASDEPLVEEPEPVPAKTTLVEEPAYSSADEASVEKTVTGTSNEPLVEEPVPTAAEDTLVEEPTLCSTDEASVKEAVPMGAGEMLIEELVPSAAQETPIEQPVLEMEEPVPAAPEEREIVPAAAQEALIEKSVPIAEDEESLEETVPATADEASVHDSMPTAPKETLFEEPVRAAADKAFVEKLVSASDEPLAEAPEPAAAEETLVEESVIAAANEALVEEPVSTAADEAPIEEPLPAESHETVVEDPVPAAAEEILVEEPVIAAADEASVAEPVPAVAEETLIEEPVPTAAEETLVEEPMPAESHEQLVEDPLPAAAQETHVGEPVFAAVKEAIVEEPAVDKTPDEGSVPTAAHEILVEELVAAADVSASFSEDIVIPAEEPARSPDIVDSDIDRQLDNEDSSFTAAPTSNFDVSNLISPREELISITEVSEVASASDSSHLHLDSTSNTAVSQPTLTDNTVEQTLTVVGAPSNEHDDSAEQVASEAAELPPLSDDSVVATLQIEESSPPEEPVLENAIGAEDELSADVKHVVDTPLDALLSEVQLSSQIIPSSLLGEAALSEGQAVEELDSVGQRESSGVAEDADHLAQGQGEERTSLFILETPPPPTVGEDSQEFSENQTTASITATEELNPGLQNVDQVVEPSTVTGKSPLESPSHNDDSTDWTVSLAAAAGDCAAVPEGAGGDLVVDSLSAHESIRDLASPEDGLSSQNYAAEGTEPPVVETLSEGSIVENTSDNNDSILQAPEERLTENTTPAVEQPSDRITSTSFEALVTPSDAAEGSILTSTAGQVDAPVVISEDKSVPIENIAEPEQSVSSTIASTEPDVLQEPASSTTNDTTESAPQDSVGGEASLNKSIEEFPSASEDLIHEVYSEDAGIAEASPEEAGVGETDHSKAPSSSAEKIAEEAESGAPAPAGASIVGTSAVDEEEASKDVVAEASEPELLVAESSIQTPEPTVAEPAVLSSVEKQNPYVSNVKDFESESLDSAKDAAIEEVHFASAVEETPEDVSPAVAGDESEDPSTTAAETIDEEVPKAIGEDNPSGTPVAEISQESFPQQSVVASISTNEPVPQIGEVEESTPPPGSDYTEPVSPPTGVTEGSHHAEVVEPEIPSKLSPLEAATAEPASTVAVEEGVTVTSDADSQPTHSVAKTSDQQTEQDQKLVIVENPISNSESREAGDFNDESFPKDIGIEHAEDSTAPRPAEEPILAVEEALESVPPPAEDPVAESVVTNEDVPASADQLDLLSEHFPVKQTDPALGIENAATDAPAVNSDPEPTVSASKTPDISSVTHTEATTEVLAESAPSTGLDNSDLARQIIEEDALDISATVELDAQLPENNDQVEETRELMSTSVDEPAVELTQTSGDGDAEPELPTEEPAVKLTVPVSTASDDPQEGIAPAIPQSAEATDGVSVTVSADEPTPAARDIIADVDVSPTTSEAALESPENVASDEPASSVEFTPEVSKDSTVEALSNSEEAIAATEIAACVSEAGLASEETVIESVSAPEDDAETTDVASVIEEPVAESSAPETTLMEAELPTTEEPAEAANSLLNSEPVLEPPTASEEVKANIDSESTVSIAKTTPPSPGPEAPPSLQEPAEQPAPSSIEDPAAATDTLTVDIAPPSTEPAIETSVSTAAKGSSEVAEPSYEDTPKTLVIDSVLDFAVPALEIEGSAPPTIEEPTEISSEIDQVVSTVDVDINSPDSDPMLEHSSPEASFVESSPSSVEEPIERTSDTEPAALASIVEPAASTPALEVSAPQTAIEEPTLAVVEESVDSLSMIELEAPVISEPLLQPSTQEAIIEESIPSAEAPVNPAPETETPTSAAEVPHAAYKPVHESSPPETIIAESILAAEESTAPTSATEQGHLTADVDETSVPEPEFSALELAVEESAPSTIDELAPAPTEIEQEPSPANAIPAASEPVSDLPESSEPIIIIEEPTPSIEESAQATSNPEQIELTADVVTANSEPVEPSSPEAAATETPFTAIEEQDQAVVDVEKDTSTADAEPEASAPELELSALEPATEESPSTIEEPSEATSEIKQDADDVPAISEPLLDSSTSLPIVDEIAASSEVSISSAPEEPATEKPTEEHVPLVAGPAPTSPKLVVKPSAVEPSAAEAVIEAPEPTTVEEPSEEASVVIDSTPAAEPTVTEAEKVPIISVVPQDPAFFEEDTLNVAIAEDLDDLVSPITDVSTMDPDASFATSGPFALESVISSIGEDEDDLALDVDSKTSEDEDEVLNGNGNGQHAKLESETSDLVEDNDVVSPLAEAVDDAVVAGEVSNGDIHVDAEPLIVEVPFAEPETVLAILDASDKQHTEKFDLSAQVEPKEVHDDVAETTDSKTALPTSAEV